MRVDPESLALQLRDDLDDLEGVTDNLFVLALNVAKIGQARITLHGASVLPVVRFECAKWWRLNVPHDVSYMKPHELVGEAVLCHLDIHADKRKALGS